MAAPASGSSGGFRQLAALYRAVLRAHRHKLPGPLRLLGDSTAGSEFRAHLRGKTTPDQWREFGRQWQAYAAALQQDTHSSSSSGAAGGGDTSPPHQTTGDSSSVLPDVTRMQLSADQQAQLAKLREAAEDLARGEGGGGGGSGGDAQQPAGR